MLYLCTIQEQTITRSTQQKLSILKLWNRLHLFAAAAEGPVPLLVSLILSSIWSFFVSDYPQQYFPVY